MDTHSQEDEVPRAAEPEIVQVAEHTQGTTDADSAPTSPDQEVRDRLREDDLTLARPTSQPPIEGKQHHGQPQRRALTPQHEEIANKTRCQAPPGPTHPKAPRAPALLLSKAKSQALSDEPPEPTKPRVSLFSHQRSATEPPETASASTRRTTGGARSRSGTNDTATHPVRGARSPPRTSSRNDTPRGKEATRPRTNSRNAQPKAQAVLRHIGLPLPQPPQRWEPSHARGSAGVQRPQPPQLAPVATGKGARLDNAYSTFRATPVPVAMAALIPPQDPRHTTPPPPQDPRQRWS